MTTYTNAMVDLKDAIWEDICKRFKNNFPDKKQVKAIADKYHVTVTEEEYNELKEEWEEY